MLLAAKNMAVASASTDVPPKILQAFKELGHIMDAKPYTFRAIQYERCYYLLWRMYAKRSCGKCNLWPLAIPEMNISSNKLGQAIEDEYAKFSAGMDEAIKRKDSSATAKTRNSSRSVSGAAATRGRRRGRRRERSPRRPCLLRPQLSYERQEPSVDVTVLCFRFGIICLLHFMDKI